MRTILRMLGHGAGVSGVLIGLGSILRALPASLPRLLPFVHGLGGTWLTSAWIGGPLSIALLGIAAMILGGGGDGG